MIRLRLEECHIAFMPREDGGKLLTVIDPASTIVVELPIGEEGCKSVGEHLLMTNEELAATIERGNAAARLHIAGAHDLAALKEPPSQ